MSTPTSRNIKKDDAVIIIGAGVFGLSTARELSNRGYSNITVLDRYPPPVPDGSSVDVSRVIRPDYADDFYAKLGLEAMQGWENEYSEFFHQCGVLVGSSQGDHPYIQQSKMNLEQRGGSMQAFRGGDDIRKKFPAITGDLSNAKGYFNPTGGWADAEGSVRYLAQQCASNGVSFISGPRGTAMTLLVKGGIINGVKTKAGDTISGDYFIFATGAWTPYLVDMSSVSVSNAQPIGFLQLTESEAQELSKIPIMFDLSSGWFAFPPTPDTHVLKIARHGYGYEVARSRVERGHISAPALSTNNAAADFLPDDAAKALRDGLALFLPPLKDRPFSRKRLCWYTDTRNGDFIVDKNSSYANLFMATGGSGHAFKFLPVLGRYIADALEGKAMAEQRAKWAWQPSTEPISKGDGSRGGPPRRALTQHERAHL